MDNDFRKKVNKDPHPALVKQYHPADAVRKRGDAWLWGREVWNVSASTNIALRESAGPDEIDFHAMARMERGEQGRV